MSLHLVVLFLVGALLIVPRVALKRPVRRPSPTRTEPGQRRFITVDETWTPEQCTALIEALDSGWELEFFAADHLSPTDPGAYIWVIWSADGLMRKAINQGWSTHRLRTDARTVGQELYRNRGQQGQAGVRLRDGLGEGPHSPSRTGTGERVIQIPVYQLWTNWLTKAEGSRKKYGLARHGGPGAPFAEGTQESGIRIRAG